MQLSGLSLAPSAETTRGTQRDFGQFDSQSFLTLLVAQLKSQNPLDPMNPTEFVNQLVQFSSLEQLIGIRQSMDVEPGSVARRATDTAQPQAASPKSL